MAEMGCKQCPLTLLVLRDKRDTILYISASILVKRQRVKSTSIVAFGALLMPAIVSRDKLVLIFANGGAF